MMLDDKLKEILDQLSISLKSIYGAKLKSVILYGSVARGTATTESDIDIMVLVDLSPEELKNYADQLWMFAILNLESGNRCYRFIEM